MEKEKIIFIIGIILTALAFIMPLLIAWKFIIIFIVALLFVIFKIDSKILVLIAILTLAIIPFLLIAKYDQQSESIAVNICYLILVSIGLQAIEYLRSLKLVIKLEDILTKKNLEIANLFAHTAVIGFGIFYLINDQFQNAFIISAGLYTLYLLCYIPCKIFSPEIQL